MVKKSNLRFKVTFPKKEYRRLARIASLFDRSISYFVMRVLLALLRSPDALIAFSQEYLFDGYSDDEKDIVLSLIPGVWSGSSGFTSSISPKDDDDFDEVEFDEDEEEEV